jgi:hypothetical protein
MEATMQRVRRIGYLVAVALAMMAAGCSMPDNSIQTEVKAYVSPISSTSVTVDYRFYNSGMNDLHNVQIEIEIAATAGATTTTFKKTIGPFSLATGATYSGSASYYVSSSNYVSASAVITSVGWD